MMAMTLSHLVQAWLESKRPREL
uniref:Calcium-transporting ATPase n=1 Tax=Rhizophora mucronata TaxID=61149 RepID=A0A2P2PPE2_RHIMU